jgi:hypothetical protein
MDEVPIATVVHAMPGRARVRVLAKMGDEAFFSELGRAVGAHPDVREVRCNVGTASVLIVHQGPLEPILKRLVVQGYVRLAPQGPKHSALHRLEFALERGNERLVAQTQGAVSFETLTFLAMFAAGLWQLKRGKFLPAGMTLFSYAYEALLRDSFRELERSQQGQA